MKRDSVKNVIFAIAAVFALMLLQSVAGVAFNGAAAIPDMFFVFSLSFACCEKKTTKIIGIAVLCGILSDSFWHTKFSWCMLIYTCGAIVMFYLKKVFMHPNIFFSSVIAFAIFVAGKCLMYPAMYKTVQFADFFVNDVIYSAFYNLAYFFVITLILECIRKRRAKYEPYI